MNHLKHLLTHTPDLKHRKILDLGSGKGAFLIALIKEGYRAEGLEYNPDYIQISRDTAEKENVEITVTQGAGEALPYDDASFDFVNMSELIEHVQNPDQVLSEVCRVLRPSGKAYLSVPNRFGFKDPHFRIRGINWLPRFLADPVLSLLNAHKRYTHDAGEQRLDRMHYYTYSGIIRAVNRAGMRSVDIRILKLMRMVKVPLVYLVVLMYLPVRAVYLNTFHLLLSKK